jgi:copper(I)-binding protein
LIGTGWGSALPRRLVLVAVAALIPVLAGCEAGNDAPTLEFHAPTETAGTAVGDLAIRNVFVLGAPLGRELAKGQSASLFLAMVNTGAPDQLISITAPGTAASVKLPGTVPVTFGHPVFLSGPKPQVVLTDLTQPLASGTTIRLVLTFQKAGPVTLIVPVMARATHYATYAPPQPAPSATLALTTAKHRKAHASASPTATASTSPSPSPSTTG